MMKAISREEVALALIPSDRSTLGELIEKIKNAREARFYLKHPLPSHLFKKLQEMSHHKRQLAIDAVVEDFSDVDYLRQWHLAGFSLFYGIALPAQTIIFLDCKQGFLLEDNQQKSSWSLRSLKNPEDLYISLLWRRFGIAVLLSGSVKENDATSGVFCLVTEGGRECWCRLKDSTITNASLVGKKIEIFAWEKWGTQVLEVLTVTVLYPGS